MIQLATPAMLPQLKTIWETCFGDSRKYVDFIFHNLAKPVQVLVHTDETGAPAAMLCMQPLWLCAPDGARCRSAYIYGVATLPRCQGKGLGTALLEGAHQHIRSSGACASVLVPADGKLLGFYEKRGYEKAFPLRRATLTAEEMPGPQKPCVLVSTALERLEGMRDQAFGDSRMLARWGRSYLAAIGIECRLTGGEVLRFTCGGENGYAVCYRIGDRVAVKEITASSEALPSVLAAIHSRMAARSYVLYLRGDRGSEFSDHVLPFGMIRWYDIEMKDRFTRMGGAPAYLAHVLD